MSRDKQNAARRPLSPPTSPPTHANNPPYTPIDSKNKEIRLIELASGSYDDEIQITLHRTKLSDKPHYEALSYVWGQDISPRPALVNGTPVSIKANLDRALRDLRNRPKMMHRLRKHAGARILWIDALCINQFSIEERGLQVQIMAQIYSSALRVVVWLGPAVDIDCMNIFPHMRRGEIPRPQDSYDRVLETIHQLASCAWFSRVWVVQELAMADQDPIMQVGRQYVTWTQFHKFVAGVMQENRFGTKPQSDPRRYCPPDWSGQVENLRRIRTNKNNQEFAYLLQQTTLCLATDPRDKVYALLGIPSTGAIVMLPDYSKTIQQVLNETIALIIKQGHVWLYWRFALQPLVPEHPQTSSGVSDLPSWVPDLTNNAIRKELFLHYNQPVTFFRYQAKPSNMTDQKYLRWLSEDLPSNCHQAWYSGDMLELHTVGVKIGNISVTSTDLFDLRAYDLTDRETFANILSMIYNEHAKPRGVSPNQLLKALYIPLIPLKHEEEVAFEELLEDPAVCMLEDSPNYSLYKEFLRNIFKGTARMTLFFTAGAVGISYHPDTINGIRTSDIVVGLFGVNLPFILRPLGGGKYQMINVAHVIDHDWGHDFLDSAAPDASWSDYEHYGVAEYIIV